ncbi:Conserved archaeal protein [Halorhabdus tiamatea SARL4B]|uniref:Conserved archaeal protein n=1 Tax=Halorhabdus tiamatea SARL4B TaxID=1033806 RepID=S6D019_9EURY|nr:alkaline phosphatase family protein [Halorhabdus tiamatea]ERJ04687.1 Conserved archaeal protein [Halorhabdus tiamatea SARL4B]CCQ33128.1 type I phosphodiesterase/nucleotide pyrophosphatase family protein [Halorhabdus tiamatea SARL4B]
MTDTIILGLDGATWDVLDPLLEDGHLPELQARIDEGQANTLESTFPPITAPAWLSMATGQNPGKTGVFYFLNRDDPDSFEFESLGSDSFQGESFWDVLAARGHSVGVFNFPMLYPPYELGENGFMVSGLGSPSDDTITKPDDLKHELDEVTGDYEVKVPYADPKYQNRPGQLASDLHEMLEKREAAMTYLLEEKRPDVFFGVVSVTDWAQHYFWRYHDPEHALYDPNADETHQNALTRLWKRVDETVGRVAEFADREDANLLLVSDHGFGPVNRTFYSNDWLESHGLRVPAETSTVQSLRTRYFPHLRRIAEPIVSAIPQLNDLAKSVGKSIRGSPGDDIDWERSVVFAPRQNLTCGMLYMLSEDPADTAAVIDALENITDSNDDPIEIDVFQPEERYEGPKTDLAPDILFTVEDFACAVDPRPNTNDAYIVDGPPSAARSGGHRMEGIYVASGPAIEPAEGEQASIFDIAPTLLYALGEPIPDVMDGESLTNLFTTEFQAERSVERQSLATLVGSGKSETERDTEAVQDQLEDLGYI